MSSIICLYSDSIKEEPQYKCVWGSRKKGGNSYKEREKMYQETKLCRNERVKKGKGRREKEEGKEKEKRWRREGVKRREGSEKEEERRRGEGIKVRRKEKLDLANINVVNK